MQDYKETRGTTKINLYKKDPVVKRFLTKKIDPVNFAVSSVTGHKEFEFHSEKAASFNVRKLIGRTFGEITQKITLPGRLIYNLRKWIIGLALVGITTTTATQYIKQNFDYFNNHEATHASIQQVKEEIKRIPIPKRVVQEEVKKVEPRKISEYNFSIERVNLAIENFKKNAFTNDDREFILEAHVKGDLKKIKSTIIKKDAHYIKTIIEKKITNEKVLKKAETFLDGFKPSLSLIKERLRNPQSSLSYSDNLGKYVIDLDKINSNLAKNLYNYSMNGVIGYDNLKVNPYLVISIAFMESNFGNTVISNVGARGPMQVMPKTLEEVYPKKKFPKLHKDNWTYIVAAFPYIENLGNILDLDVLNGDITSNLVIASSYNNGPTKIRSSSKEFKNLNKETLKYINIMASLHKLVVFKIGDKIIAPS